MIFVTGTRPKSSGIPDVANAAVDLTSSISAEGGSVGRRVLASRHNGCNIASMEYEKISDEGNSKRKHEKIFQYSQEHNLSWTIRLDNDLLYVELPQEFCEESKEKFVSLLELAGDTLHCKHIIIYFNKARADRAMVVKTFMFLGFRVLTPQNTLMKNVNKNPDQIFMVYIIDDDE